MMNGGGSSNNNNNKERDSQAKYFDTADPRLEEIKKLLDDNGLKEKMEGMKRLLALMSKGQDVSVLFPYVVKNVVCPNMTVKKLVYMYIVHYAELEPDPALLAINNFQRDMQNDNQLQRALGLRVLSSIRLRVTVQVVLLAVKRAAKDGSAYVRKAAAHALPKLHSLDHEQLPDLEETLQSLLKDHSTMVLGSTMWAFNELCPDKFEYLHPHFRKICKLLIDMDEWGQIITLNVLTRYARTQFINPDTQKPESAPKEKKKRKSTWEDGSSTDDSDETSEEEEDEDMSRELDTDHRLLLRVILPLLKSRNAAVVMAVATLYFYVAPRAELSIVARPLTRLLRTTREVEYLALNTISDMAAIYPQMFVPHLLDFFINPSDALFARRLKLDILTNLATDSNINSILNELNIYVHSEDKELVTTSIQAIGRCATRLTDVTDSCMRTLMLLISHPSESVVAESVVVIKKLLQMGEKADFPLNKIVTQLARLLPNVQVPKARAAIVWVIGEYHHTIPLLAPDLLRTLAKSYIQEDDTVKVQVLNLGAKLVLTNAEQTSLLFQYILDLSAYDMNYDIRDKARLMRKVALPSATSGELSSYAERLFLSKKPAPMMIDETDRQRFVLGTLSHMVKHKVMGYSPIPDYVEVAPDTDRTDLDDINLKSAVSREVISDKKDKKAPKSWSDTDSDTDSDSYTGSDTGSYTDTGSYSGSDSENDERGRRRGHKRSDSGSRSRSNSGTRSYSDSYSDSDRSRSPSPSGSDSYTDSESDEPAKKSKGQKQAPPPKKGSAPAAKASTPVVATKKQAASAKSKAGASLLDFDSDMSGPSDSTPVGGLDFMSSLSGLSGLDLGSSGATLAPSLSNSGSVGTNVSQKHALLNHVTGGGLSIDYRFIRRASMHGSAFNSIQLIFENHSSDTPISNIHLSTSHTTSNNLIPFPDIAVLPPKGTAESVISAVFSSVSQSIRFDVSTDRGTYPVSLQPSLGELLRPRNMSAEEFDASYKKLAGMNESNAKYSAQPIPSNSGIIGQVPAKIQEYFNVAPISVDIPRAVFRYAGSALLDEKLFLLSVSVKGVGAGSEATVEVKVNGENTILASMAAAKLVSALKELLPAAAASSTKATTTTATSTAAPSTTTTATTAAPTATTEQLQPLLSHTTPPTTTTLAPTTPATPTTPTVTAKAKVATKAEDSSDSDDDVDEDGFKKEVRGSDDDDSDSDSDNDNDKEEDSAVVTATAEEGGDDDKDGYSEL